MTCIKSIADRANLSNQAFRKAALLPDHKIYNLNGIERFFPQRVNSMKRLKFLYDSFKGFECDIQFDQDTKTFFIGHDGLENDPQLQEFLEWDKERKIFWLDLKNLSVDTAAFSAALKRLDAKFAIRNRVIIESINRQIVQKASEEGYFASYYLPNNLKNDTVQKELANFCRSGSSDIASFSEDIIFTDAIRSFCPEKKQITWDSNFWHSLNRKVLLKNVNDSSILVCLLNIKSPGYR